MRAMHACQFVLDGRVYVRNGQLSVLSDRFCVLSDHLFVLSDQLCVLSDQLCVLSGTRFDPSDRFLSESDGHGFVRNVLHRRFSSGNPRRYCLC